MQLHHALRMCLRALALLLMLTVVAPVGAGEGPAPTPLGRVDRFAIVSCGASGGGAAHRRWYWGSNVRICRMLERVYGYPEASIYRLHEDGRRRGPAVDGDLRDVELSRLLSLLPTRNITIALTPCFSGGFVPRLSGAGRVICTSTTGKEPNAAGWEQYFTNALAGGGDADRDGDGRVSLKEAYNAAADGTTAWYARKKLPLAEHPLLDDNGVGRGPHRELEGAFP